MDPKGKGVGPILLTIEDSGAATWTVTEIRVFMICRKFV
jgi:hypothetical protein